MKVRITFDITDDQRVAISASQGEGFKPASREEIVEFINDLAYNRLRTLGATYREAMDDVIAKLNN